MNRSKIFLTGFVLAFLADSLSVEFGSSLHYVFKPAIIPCLIGYYLSEAPVRNMLFIRALVFCWVGDFLLLFVPMDELYFILGLVAFLIGHILYIRTFQKLVNTPQSPLLPTQKLRMVFPVFLAGTGLITILYAGLGPMRIPVIAYAVVIMVMAASAILRLNRTNIGSYWYLVGGAAIFMLSDSLLALNKFYSPFVGASVAIMATYVLAQYLIVRGVLAHKQ